MASSSTSSVPKKSFKYDVFLSFRGEDTRTNFTDHLYSALQHKSIYTYKDDLRIKKGERIDNELIRSIEDSRFHIIVFSKNYASSSWCLDELVKIMDCHKQTGHTAYPVFYDVGPSEVRNQSGAVVEAFAKHEKKVAAGKWREALKEAADLAGWELKKTADGHEAKLIKRIVEEVSLELRSVNFRIDEKLVGMETRINNVVSSLGSVVEDVRMIGISGIGGGGKTTLARAVFDQISYQFEGKSFVENVREVSKPPLSGLISLQKQVLSDILNDHGINISSVSEGKNVMWRMMRGRKVLVVLDDVDRIDQLEALAGERNWFKPGSTIIITTRDEQVLVAHGVTLIHNVNLLSDKEATCLFSKYAFGREIPIQGYEELSTQVVRYAVGLPLTITVLGSFLCGKNDVEWIDVLKRLKKIPLMETLRKLELSYTGLEQDYKEIFLDVACILKGTRKDSAIEVLESCGFHARNGLRVLEQKSLITIYVDYGHECVGMHDHIEEMGRNVIRRLHPDMPYKHSRLWIKEEIEDILVNDLGTEETRCIKYYEGGLDPETVMKGLRKMKELRFLDVHLQDSHTNPEINKFIPNFLNALEILCCNWKFNEVSPYVPDALKYLRWSRYPFRSLPKTFQANNLVSLDIANSDIVQLWEGGKRKVLNKLRFLDLGGVNLRIFNLGLTPNLETLRIFRHGHSIELYMPVGCLNLRSLDLHDVKLRTLDLGLTPNLEELRLERGDLVDMPGRCLNLRELFLKNVKLRTLDIRLTPNLEYLKLDTCNDLEELHMGNECVKLRSLYLNKLKVRTLDLGPSPYLERLDLNFCNDLEEFHVAECPILTYIKISDVKLRTLNLMLVPNIRLLCLEWRGLEELRLPSRCINLHTLLCTNSYLRTLDIGLTPNLAELYLEYCYNLEELHLVDQCQKLASLDISRSNLRTLDLGLTPDLERLDLKGCYYLVELHTPAGCLKNIVYLNLSGCLGFYKFLFHVKDNTSGRVDESVEVRPSVELHFILNSCPIHPDHNLLEFEFTCFHKEGLPLLRRSIEKLISGGPCACTKLERFSRSICRLQLATLNKA